MKALKIIGITLLSLIALLLVISLFLPSQIHVERSIVVNAPIENAFEQVNVIKNWEKWSPWIKMDPTTKLDYFGPASGTGAGYKWASSKTGTGTLTFSDVKPNETIKTDLDFGGHGKATAGHNFEPAEGGVKISWYLDTDKSGNPISKYMNVMMKGMLEKQFDQGLADIKRLAESMPPPVKKPEIKIEATTVTAQPYLAIRDSGTMATIGQKLGMNYHTIGEAMKKQKLNIAGAPFAIYYSDSQTNWMFDAAIAVDKPGKADGKVQPGEIKAGNAVLVHYFGDYSGIHSVYSAIKEWINTNGKKQTGAPWEVYVTDPGTEKDTAKWQTDVYFPIETP